MQLNLEKNTVKTTQTVFEGTPEQGFETDILLPDYCKDITRILKCNATSKISRISQNANTVDIDGVVLINIYYLCIDNKINSYSTRVMFSKTLTLNSDNPQLSVRVSSQIQYLNCRAVNSRRLDIRGAVTLLTCVTSQDEKSIVNDCTENVQLLKHNVTSLCQVGDFSHSFNVREEIPSQTQITSILRTHATANQTEIKIINNKLIIKGQMSVHLTTKNDNDEIQHSSYTIPISQIADVEGVSEESICCVDFDVVSLDVNVKNTENGQILEFDAKILLTVNAKNTCDVTVCDDCYGTECEVKAKKENVTISTLCQHIDERKIYKHTFALFEGDTTLCDLWYEEKPLSQSFENDALNLTLGVVISMISQNDMGECHYTEQTLPVIETIRLKNAQSATFEGNAKVCDCNYTLTQNGVEVTLTVGFLGNVISKNAINVITDLECDETKKYKDSDCALTIYFATKGESVWEIAKRYHTKKDAIALANNLETDTVSGGIILIPNSI